MKLTEAEPHILRTPYAKFHPDRTINVESAVRSPLILHKQTFHWTEFHEDSTRQFLIEICMEYCLNWKNKQDKLIYDQKWSMVFIELIFFTKLTITEDSLHWMHQNSSRNIEIKDRNWSP